MPTTDLTDLTAPPTAVDAWIRGVCDELSWPGPALEHVHDRPWARVWRVRTASGTGWLKLDLTRRGVEAPLLDALVPLAPGHVPQLLAAERTLSALLVRDAGAVLPLGHQDWCSVLEQYGRLQRLVEPHVDALVARGVPDLRPAALEREFRGVVDRAEADRAVDGDTATRLRARQGQVARWAAVLASHHAAPSVQHDDLHPGNVVRGADGRRRIIDWADASVAHPWASLLYPLDLADRGAVDLRSAGDADRRDLIRAYLAGREEHLDREALDVVHLACRTAAVGRALVWESCRRLPGAAAMKEYYRTGVDRWLDRLLDVRT